MSMILAAPPRCSFSGRHVRVEAAEQEARGRTRTAATLVRSCEPSVLNCLRVARAARVLDLEQLAVVVERPAVEGAGEGGPVVLLAPAEHRALVAAGVDQRVQLAVLVAGDHDRLPAHVDRQVVVVVRQLALVGQVDPVALEDVLHLQLEDVGVGERVAPAPVDPPLGIDLQRGVDLRPELVGGAAVRHVRCPSVAEGLPSIGPRCRAVASSSTSGRDAREPARGPAAIGSPAWPQECAFALEEHLGPTGPRTPPGGNLGASPGPRSPAR